MKIGKVYVDGSANVSPRLWGCTAANVGSSWSHCAMVKMTRRPSILISLSLLFRSGQASSTQSGVLVVEMGISISVNLVCMMLDRNTQSLSESCKYSLKIMCPYKQHKTKKRFLFRRNVDLITLFL